MNEKESCRRGRGVALVLLAGLLLQASTWAQPDQRLAPGRDQARVLGQSLSVLERGHYNPLALNDTFATKTLQSYLSELDPTRMVFLQPDVEEFETAYDATLDDALRELDLDPAFDVFQRFVQRRDAQLDYLVQRAGEDPSKMVFDGQETLERDRRHAAWPSDAGEARNLWERVYENDVLTARLEGRSPEQIETTLKRRYTGQRQQMDKVTSDDVFALFLNVVTGEFDPHTNYFPPLGAENFEMAMALSFEGIGALLGSDGEYALVESLIPGGPAERSGELHPTDRIAAIGQGEDGPMTDVVGWRTDAIVGLIRGPRGSTVRLQVLPDGAADASSRMVVLERDRVKLEDQAARSEVRELTQGGVTYHIGVITVPGFYMDFEAAQRGAKDYRSSTRDVARLLAELHAQTLDGIVLDLRNNGGGALAEARSLAGLFLGQRPVVQVRDAKHRVEVLGAPTRAAYTGPLVVLVNRLSASASEIFAAAIQDHGRGVVVGSQTFGKGTVQGLIPLENGELKVTQAKFYRISGASTQDVGVEPDVPFPPVYDPQEVGESALPEALPFDRVPPIAVQRDDSISAALPALLERHQSRAAQDPDFKARTERLAVSREIEKRTEVSLNETRRRHEQQSVKARFLQIENDRRAALGLAALDKTAELASLEPEGDPDLTEAARIAIDLARLPSHPALVERSPTIRGV